MRATAPRPDRTLAGPGMRAPLALLASVPLHPVRLSPPPLRTAAGHSRDERRASWLELFFDLVFAGAVGQLAGALQDHPGLAALARFAMLFTAIWWLWVQFSFYADRHESEDAAHRGAFAAAMLLCARGGERGHRSGVAWHRAGEGRLVGNPGTGEADTGAPCPFGIQAEVRYRDVPCTSPLSPAAAIRSCGLQLGDQLGDPGTDLRPYPRLAQHMSLGSPSLR